MLPQFQLPSSSSDLAPLDRDVIGQTVSPEERAYEYAALLDIVLDILFFTVRE
jgi:hypothetical protein